MDEVRITLVPHTHWDREWYAPFAEFRERLVAMMDTLLELAEGGFPHFHLDGQVAMVDDYLDARPEREGDLRLAAAEGKLSLGPWFTQMDEFLTSGESHIRNLELGLSRARELGPVLLAGYLPDQFGHIGQMPQLLRRAGIDRAVVWRGVPSSIGSTSFRWRSPDGSEVRAEYMAFGYFFGDAFRQIEDPDELAAEIHRSIERLRPMLAGDRILVMVGADHTGPDPTLPRRVAAASSRVEGARVEIAGIEHHLDDQAPAEVPTWEGELRSSARAHLLPNVVSGRAPQKRERGRVESLLERYADPLSALVGVGHATEERLARAWRLLLWNGAHDSACGCSHDQVARDVEARFAEARTICEDVIAESLATLERGAGSAAGLVRFNPSPFEREGIPPLGVRVADGRTDPTEVDVDVRIEDGWVVAEGLSFSFRDEPDVGDLYNFCPVDEGQVATPPEELAVEDDEVVASWPDLRVRVRVSRREGEPFLRLAGEIHNDRPDHRLRLHVRLAEPADGALAGSPFELVRRPLVSEGGELESPSSTWPARHVVQAGGIAAYHEGVVEYDVAGAELALTLLRCVGTISRERLATRPFAAGPGVPTPEAQMIGTSTFAIGLRSSTDRLGLLRDWERFALPILEATAIGSRIHEGSLIDIAGDAILSTIRRVGDGIQVRGWNPFDDREVRWWVEGAEHDLGPARIHTVTVTRRPRQEVTPT